MSIRLVFGRAIAPANKYWEWVREDAEDWCSVLRHNGCIWHHLAHWPSLYCPKWLSFIHSIRHWLNNHCPTVILFPGTYHMWRNVCWQIWEAPKVTELHCMQSYQLCTCMHWVNNSSACSHSLTYNCMQFVTYYGSETTVLVQIVTFCSPGTLSSFSMGPQHGFLVHSGLLSPLFTTEHSDDFDCVVK